MTMGKLISLVKKDLLIELRAKELVVGMFTFSVLVLFVFSVALGSSPALTSAVTPAVVWITFIFAASLGLGRSFALERDGGALMGVLATPTDRSVLFLGKLISNLVFVGTVELVTLPVLVVFYNVDLTAHAIELALVLFLGTVGFVCVGTVFSAISSNTRLREVLLPVMLFPVVVPVVVGAVRLTESVLSGRGLGGGGGSLKLLLSFDIIFFVVCTVVFEYVIEE